jgi:hypothetical protein
VSGSPSRPEASTSSSLNRPFSEPHAPGCTRTASLAHGLPFLVQPLSGLNSLMASAMASVLGRTLSIAKTASAGFTTARSGAT